MNSRSTRPFLVCLSMVCLIEGLSCGDDKCTDPRLPSDQDPPGMIWIHAGCVRLGQGGHSIGGPPHNVWVDGFWIGKYEVTNGEYKRFIDAGSYTTEAYWGPIGWAEGKHRFDAERLVDEGRAVNGGRGRGMKYRGAPNA